MNKYHARSADISRRLAWTQRPTWLNRAWLATDRLGRKICPRKRHLQRAAK